MPVLQITVFGCIVIGRTTINGIFHRKTSNLLTEVITDDLDKLITSFWRIEDVKTEVQSKCEHNDCEQLEISNTKRNEKGQYVVPLPFSQDSTQTLGSSRNQAVKRFLMLERRLNNSQTLRSAHEDFLNEYLENDEMELVPENSEPEHNYYLPHHPVIKESSSTTRLRVVFDASAKTSSSNALNDILIIGPHHST